MTAAGRNIGQACSAQSSETTGHFAAEKVGREVHKHVAHFDAVGCLHGENLAPHGKRFLQDPSASGVRKSLLKSCFPLTGVNFPAKSYACAAIFVIRLQHKILSILARVLKQTERFAIAGGLHISEQTRPRDVASDYCACAGGEKSRVSLVGENGEKCFLMRNFTSKRVGHTNRA